VPFCASAFVAAVFFQPLGAPSALPYEVTLPVRKAFLKPGMAEEKAEAFLGTKGRPCAWFERLHGALPNARGWLDMIYQVGRGRSLRVEYLYENGRWTFRGADLRTDEPAGVPKGVRGGAVP
jgi:hypothetical protein